MREALFDLLIIPAVFILGRLSRSVHITGFRVQQRKVQKELQKM